MMRYFCQSKSINKNLFVTHDFFSCFDFYVFVRHRLYTTILRFHTLTTTNLHNNDITTTDPHKQLHIEFRPESFDGIILLTGERDDLTGDFMAVLIHQGFIEFW